MPELHASKGGQRQYCFGEFTLDLGRGFLRKGSEEVALRPQAFEVLTYLVQHHGRLVPKEELFGSVWPETVRHG
jgi:DNA-binding winged helix-turn-helix (wHTH) protein